MKKTLFALITVALFSSTAIAKKIVPADVFHWNMTKNLPIVYSLAKESGATIPNFKFPTKKNKAVSPVDVYFVLYFTYSGLAKKFGMPKIAKKEIKKVIPADVYELSKQIFEQLSKKTKARELASVDQALLDAYKAWKETTGKIIPGDVFVLANHIQKVSSKIKKK